MGRKSKIDRFVSIIVKKVKEAEPEIISEDSLKKDVFIDILYEALDELNENGES